jgi:hypothetical protein
MGFYAHKSFKFKYLSSLAMAGMIVELLLAVLSSSHWNNLFVEVIHD